jgi:ketosteroid isomerase-like protein
MSKFTRDEVYQTHERYLALRGEIERGNAQWSSLADFFVEDATFIDPAWGRVAGQAAIRHFFSESMTGLEGWTFPQEFCLIEGDLIVTRWLNRLPGQRADGSYYEAPGISTIYYAGNGKFRHEEDLLNMVHVIELIKESGWRPGPGAKAPPTIVPR